MIWDYVSALSGIVGTLVGLLITLYAFLSFRRAAITCQLRESRLPDATRFEDLRRQIVDSQQRLDVIQEELFLAKEEIGKSHIARAEYKQLNERIDLSRAELDGVRTVYLQRRHEAEAAHGQRMAELQENLNVLGQQLQQKQRVAENELSAHETRLATKIDQLEHEYEVKTRNISTAYERRKQELEQELSLLNSTLEHAKSQCSQKLAAFKSQVDTEMETLERSINTQRERVAEERDAALLRTQREFDEQTLEITAAFEKQKMALTVELSLLEAQVGTIRNEVNGLLEAKDELKDETNTLANRHSELTIEVNGLRSEKAQLETTIPKLEELWKRLLDQTGGGDDGERTSELWQPVFTRQDLVETFSEKEGLQDVRNYLRSCGLRYSDRTLNAFHTSLKVTDTSPLVVLAGISGTGKSELPRRYAEALGINFLNLAVQPRWDSPQDMFGFFNYLENRFRATELGRALVQMDPFYEEPDRGWPAVLPAPYINLSEQMLIVLLDEMNLARVEYYFSEFLSRLEIRRGVRRDEAHDRRKAEIPLEIGRAGLGSPTLNIFADSNVLFVGTMNEDETTQTLSDKVMDRANVIRFGRPRSLELREQIGEAEPAEYQMQSATWAEWKVASHDMSADRDQLEDWIERLNQAMALVKRPFAHRTSQAIRAYVANYPQLDAQWFQHAVADQIEQKLLPKFRGLDPSESEVRESLDKIRDVIDELEDSELREAVQASRDSHQFSWSGVDRDVMQEEQQ